MSGEFLHALLLEAASPDMDQRAGALGLDLTQPHLVIALKMEEPDAHYLDTLRRSTTHGVTGLVEKQLVVLMPTAQNLSTDGALQQAARYLKMAAPFRGLGVTAGVAQVAGDLDSLRRAFREACRAAQVGERVWGAGRAYHYEHLGIYQLLAQVEPGEFTLAFVSAIDKLLAYEQESRMELIRTLEAYFASNGNIRKASEKLFAHYNTVLYRLERIKQITGIDLEDPEGRLYLQVSLYAARLFGTLPTPAERAKTLATAGDGPLI